MPYAVKSGSQAPISGYTYSGTKILVFDDNIVTCFLLESMIELAPYWCRGLKADLVSSYQDRELKLHVVMRCL